MMVWKFLIPTSREGALVVLRALKMLVPGTGRHDSVPVASVAARLRLTGDAADDPS